MTYNEGRPSLLGREGVRLVVLRLRVVAVVVGMVVAGLGVLGVASPASATEALDGPVTLPLSDARDVVVDHTHHVLYVAGGADDDHVAVVSPDGQTISQIEGVSHVRQLALSGDGSTLYVSTVSSGVYAIDTKTHVVTLAVGACAHSMAAVGDRLWIAAAGPGCQDYDNELMVYDPGSQTLTQPFADGPHDYPLPDLEAVPGQPYLLVGAGGTTVIDTDTPNVVAQRNDVSVNQQGDLFDGGGTTWVTQGGARFSLPDLTPVGTEPLPDGYPTILAGNASYLVVSGQGLGLVDRSNGQLLRRISLGSSRVIGIAGFVFLDGTLDVVAVSPTSAELFTDTTPSAGAPDLTVSVTDPVALHAATISGTLTDQGSPVAGATVHVADESGTELGSAVTDGTGAWNLTHTYTQIRVEEVQAESDPVPGHKRAYAFEQFTVQQPTIAVTAPTSVAPHQTIDMQGTVTSVGDPVTDSGIEWAMWCGYGGVGPTDQGTVTTDRSGHFALTVDPGTCVSVRVSFGWGLSGIYPGYPGFQAPAHVDVLIPWKVAQLSIDVPSEEWAGDTVETTVTDTLDGEPQVGVPLRLTLTGPGCCTTQDLSGTTDAQGQVLVEIATTGAGWYELDGRADTTTDTITVSANGNTLARSVTTVLTASASPSQVEVGDQVSVSGDITREHGPISGVTLRLVAVDDSDGSTHREQTTTTDAQGDYVFHDNPTKAGGTTYEVLFDGDEALYPSSTPAYAFSSVSVHQSQITLTSDRTTYAAGAVAKIHLDLTDTPDRQVVLFWNDLTSGAHGTLFDGVLPAGGIDLPLTMRTNIRVGASTNASSTQTGTNATLDLDVRLGLTTRVLRPRAARPQVQAHATPHRAGACVRFEVQRRVSTGWMPQTRTSCRKLSASGTASWRVPKHYRNGRYRVSSVFAGDAVNLASTSPWVRFQIR
jgi:hypothetical protein